MPECRVVDGAWRGRPRSCAKCPARTASSVGMQTYAKKYIGTEEMDVSKG